MPDANKKQILFIPSMVEASDFGGITHQRELIKHLSTKFSVSLVRDKGAPTDKGVLPEYSDGDVTTAKRIGYARHIYSSGKELAIQNNVKLIYARHGLATLPAIKLSKKLNVPVILEVNGILSDEKDSSWLLRKIDRDGAKHATRIIAVTDGIKTHLIENHQADPEKITVIPNGANTKHFRPMEMDKARELLKLDSGNIVVYVGNLETWQGVETIIDAAPAVLKQRPDTKFIICGSGPMGQKLSSQSKKLGTEKSIIFTGPVPYDKVPYYMNSGDVCIVPKKPLKSGYSPLKLYEYMACGRPVIASKLPGFEILEKYNAGLLTPSGDADSMAKNIIKLLENPELAGEMGKNGRKLVEEKYSWISVAERVSAVCLEEIE